MDDTRHFMDHITLRTPFVWVTTEEPTRVIDQIAQESGRPTFRLDVMQGLLQFEEERDRWLKVTTTDPHDPETIIPVDDPQTAFTYVMGTHDSIMLIPDGDDAVKQMGGVLLSMLLQFRTAFFDDDFDKLPSQFVLLSHEDELPDNFRRMATHVMHGLPDEAELIALTEHIATKVKMSHEVQRVAKAGLGLSESEFINISLVGAREQGKIDATYIDHEKKELLKKTDVLDLRTPKFTLEDLGGLDNAKKLVSQIAWMWSNPEELADLDLHPLRRLLLVGVPGCGKSLLAEAIASMLDVDLGKGGVSQAMNKFVGESEARMRRTFATLRQLAPIVFWIDEFGRDLSGGASSATVDGGTTDRVHGEFLTGLQELPDDVFLAAAANRIDELPPEMLRADRFDRIMFVGMPTQAERIDIFRIHLGKRAGDHDLHMLADATPFFTGAEIKSLIQTVKFEVGTTEQRPPTTDDLLQAVPGVRGRVWINRRADIVKMYQRALVEWDWASSAQRAEANKVLNAASDPAPTATYTPKAPKMQFGK